MADKMDMSLDDIIKTSKVGVRGRGRGRGRGGPRNAGQQRGGQRNAAPLRGVRKQPQFTSSNRGNVEGKWNHDMFEGGKGGARSSGTSKITISNLEFGVSDTDIRELFGEFGPLKTACVHYDRSGRSRGTAEVVFERRSDALRAVKEYNGVPLDGRPMNIMMATSDIGALSRVGASPRGRGGAVKRLGQVGGGRGGAGRGGRGTARGGGRGAGNKGKAPTAEELDAELESYRTQLK